MSAVVAAVVAFVGTQFGQAVMGILGTALEDLGERKRWKFLVAIGVRLEALGSDVPKFIKGK